MTNNCANCENCPFGGGGIPSDLHEIHVTVSGDPVQFRTVCVSHDIKPIIIAYQGQQGQSLTDVMTSQTFIGNCDEAIETAHRIADLLCDHGFKPARIKIETTPTNPIVETTTDGYFEGHVAAQVLSKHIQQFRTIMSEYTCSKSGSRVHVSKNAFKKSGLAQTMMVTYRLYGNDKDTFTQDLEELNSYIHSSGYGKSERVISEFCWYDSNVNHDDEWMGYEKETISTG